MLLSTFGRTRGAATRIAGAVGQLRSFKLAPGQIGVERHTAEPTPAGGVLEPGAIKPPLDHHTAKKLMKNLEVPSVDPWGQRAARRAP